MCRIYWLVILLYCCCARLVLAEASCEKFRLGGRTIFFNCGGFTNVSEFATVIPRPEHSRHGFMLYNSRVEYLPVDAFEGLTALNVTFNNVHMENFEPSHPNAFERLNGTLEGLGFLGRSTLPASWSLLKNVLSLTSLRLERQTVSIDRDWNNLPRSLRSMFIKHCNVKNMEPGSLDALTGLEQFSITENKLKNFSWAVLPNPAPSLHTILLGENELTEIPKRLMPEQFPALSVLHLKFNKITSWDAETIDAIRRHPNNPKLYLDQCQLCEMFVNRYCAGADVSTHGLPIFEASICSLGEENFARPNFGSSTIPDGMIPCDCGMLVLLQIPNEQIFATCSSPEHWMHRRIH